MENQKIAKEIFGLENKFWTAMKENDAEAMMALSDDPCILAGAQGVMKFKRKDFTKMMDEATYKLLDFDLKDEQVSVLNEDTVVIAYKVREDLIVDGKPVSFEASDASTWIRKNGKWVCSLHTESISGDPYGRDHQTSVQ